MEMISQPLEQLQPAPTVPPRLANLFQVPSTPEKQTQTEIWLSKSINISPGNSPPAHFKRPLKPLCSTMQFITHLSPAVWQHSSSIFLEAKMLQLLDTENKGDLRSPAFNLPSTEWICAFLQRWWLGFSLVYFEDKAIGKQIVASAAEILLL